VCKIFDNIDMITHRTVMSSRLTEIILCIDITTYGKIKNDLVWL
jgi:hypothetical protein